MQRRGGSRLVATAVDGQPAVSRVAAGHDPQTMRVSSSRRSPRLNGVAGDSPQNGGDGARPAEGWLAAVVPAGARRFRAADPLVRQALAAAGAELTESDPDVEIAPPGTIRGDAPIAIATMLATAQDGSLPMRALA